MRSFFLVTYAVGVVLFCLCFPSPHLLYGGIDLGSESKSARSSASCTLLFDGVGFCLCIKKVFMYKYTPPTTGEYRVDL